ncbi:MAG TPA: histidine ammonia-lyase [Steroidobacteraceae bacterium]|nr:histidine ammonia-lyase [Steroidobacteraceae bacterium]
MAALTLKPGAISLAELRRIARGSGSVALADGWRGAVEASLAAVAKRLAAGEALYGINTGFGKLAKTRVPEDALATLQLYIVRSHAAGVGEPLADSTVRLTLVLKAASLARGYSGVRPAVIERLLAFVNAGIHPLVPSQGSVGASGDLAPLAHLSLALIGEGRVRVQGREMDSAAALKAAGIEPLVLGPKEGLALLNGTQVSTALALEGLFAAEDLLAGSIVAGSMCVDAALGSRTPFDARIHNVRGQPAQIAVAAAFRAVLGESEIGHSHEHCDRVQDPYSLRCQPQVAGACLQQVENAARTLMLEANGVSDNPLVFGADGEVLSGGNFHAEPVAFAADGLALALAEIGALSERRIAMLIDDSLSQLPAFLVKEGGLNSGFMIAQVTAAALASENKSLAHPASVDSLPTSANQEDHVSMATFASRRLSPMAENTRGILAIELLAAAQGIDFRRPMKSSPALEKAHALLRARVPFYDHDRHFAPDIAAAKTLIAGEELLALVPSGLLPSR